MAKALKATLLLLALALLAAIPAVISANTEKNGVTFRITAQQAAPSVSISAGANVQVRLTSPVPVTATFSEPVSGFTLDDISVVNGTADGFSGSDADAVYTSGLFCGSIYRVLPVSGWFPVPKPLSQKPGSRFKTLARRPPSVDSG